MTEVELLKQINRMIGVNDLRVTQSKRSALIGCIYSHYKVKMLFLLIIFLKVTPDTVLMYSNVLMYLSKSGYFCLFAQIHTLQQNSSIHSRNITSSCGCQNLIVKKYRNCQINVKKGNTIN